MSRGTDIADRQLTPEELRLLDLLYGELEGEEEAAALREVEADAARADEMAAFSRVRQMVRELPDAEPSPAVSARLLHAAAMAAPAARPAAERAGLWARIKGFFQPVFMHPAMTAAATFVLVAGVAGTLYLTGNFDRAEPRARSTATPPAEETAGEAGRDTATMDPGAAVTAPTGGMQVDLPTTSSGEPIEVDGKNLADETRKPEPPGLAPRPVGRRAQGSGGKPGDLATPKEKPGKKVDLKESGKGSADDNAEAPPADAPATSGSAADKDMIEAEEAAPPERKPPATKAPAPAEPSPAPQAPAPPPKQTEQSKGEQNNRGLAITYHNRAIQAARDGECDAVVSLGTQVRKLDLGYYNASYRNDKRLSPCLSKATSPASTPAKK